MYPLLTDSQVESALKDLDGWRVKDKALTRRFRFENYMDALKFVEAVAVDAASREHYPDVLFTYLEVVIVLSSHDGDGLTELDIITARAVDKLAGTFGAA